MIELDRNPKRLSHVQTLSFKATPPSFMVPKVFLITANGREAKQALRHTPGRLRLDRRRQLASQPRHPMVVSMPKIKFDYANTYANIYAGGLVGSSDYDWRANGVQLRGRHPLWVTSGRDGDHPKPRKFSSPRCVHVFLT